MNIDLVELGRDEFPWKVMQCAKVIIGMIGSSGISQLLENCLKKGPETFPDKNQRFCDPNQLYETIIRCHNSQILRNQ